MNYHLSMELSHHALGLIGLDRTFFVAIGQR
jgi:hypothetical protein